MKTILRLSCAPSLKWSHAFMAATIICRKSLLLILMLVSFIQLNAQGSSDSIPDPYPKTYTSFNGAVLNLFAWEGNKVVILSRNKNLNKTTMQKWLKAMDATYQYYTTITGREPSINPPTYINNRTTIADVPSTCGAGCGYLGTTGIELQNTYFDIMYNEINNNDQYDQVAFYEFGRNFWFYGNKIAYKANDPIATGYAVFMRFMAMEAAGVAGAPFNSWSFETFKSNVENLINTYLADPTLNWANTLGIGQGVPGSQLGATDLFASFLFYLRGNYGGDDFLKKLWKNVEQRPNANTTQDAVDNFFIAASAAANMNLTSLFQSWRWPLSAKAISEASNYPVSLPPTILTFSPTSGPVSTTVTITGTNFDLTPANNIVYFGAVKATVTAASSTSLTVTVPVGATYQPITVTTGGLTAYSNASFNPTFPNANAVLTPNSFGAQLNLPGTGAGFSNGNLIAKADFDGDNKLDIAQIIVGSNTLSIYRNQSTIGNVLLSAKVDYATGTRPYSMEVGDIDGDGRLDIVVVNNTSNTLSVYQNLSSNGVITFAQKKDFATGTNPTNIAIGDLDADGRPDIAFTNLIVNNTTPAFGSVSVLKNTSSGGTINLSSAVNITVGFSPYAVIIRDLDSDGAPDLAVTNYGSSTLSLLRHVTNKSTLAFEAKLDINTGDGGAHLAAEDLDGDNKLDLVIALPAFKSAAILRNISSIGSLSFAPVISFSTDGFATTLDIGDLDGDGRPDLAVGNTASTVSVFRNLSSPGAVVFSGKTDYPLAAAASSVTIGDLDGDNKADLSVTTSLGTTIFRNQISSIVQPPVITTFSPASGQVGTTVTITGTNFSPIADNNIVYFGAVKATVTTATSTSITVTVPTGATYEPISVTTNNLTAYSTRPFMPTFANSCPGFAAISFSGPTTYAAGTDPRNLATADFDGDGRADIAETNIASGTVSVFRNTSIVGTISLAAKRDFLTGAGPERVATADFDGDGKPDMVVANGGSGTVSVFRNISSIGNISFATKIDHATGSASRGVAIGDFNGDGKPDLVVANTNSSTISFLTNTSVPGTISFGAKVDYATGSGPHAIAVGDLEGDSKPDIAVANLNSNTVSIFKNTSTNTTISFTTQTQYPLAGNNSFGIALGDLDGDGKADLTTSSLTPGTISVFRNTSLGGTIAFATRIDYPVASAPLNVAISDMDGDGKLDLAVANFSSSNFSILKNNSTAGTISFGGEVRYGSGIPSTNIVSVDLDGDGKSDIATSAYNINSLTVFRNQVGCIQGCTPPTFQNDGRIVLDASCGNNDGGIWIFPTTGTAPFTYSINGGATYVTGPNTGRGFQNLAAGTYQLRIRDASGCESAIVERTIKTSFGLPAFLNNNQTVTDATCGNRNGSINIIPSVGTAPFMYSINGGTTYVSGPNTGFTFNNLAPGTYQLRLKDSKGCESEVIERRVSVETCPTPCTAPPTFVNNNLIVLDASCGRSDGAIHIIPTSGTAPFMYSINGGATYVHGPDAGYGFQNLPAGTYQLRLKDARGCESAIVTRTVRNYYNCSGMTVSKNTAPAPFALSNQEVIFTYPNPSRGQFKLMLQNFKSSKAEVSIVDTKGTVIQKRSLNLTQTTIVDFDLKGQASGLYTIKVVSTNGTKVSKVLIQ